MTGEKIEVRDKVEVSPDGWVCVCGNIAEAEGFFPCDENGLYVEPTIETWPKLLYLCDRCGRIISDERIERPEIVKQIDLDARLGRDEMVEAS